MARSSAVANTSFARLPDNLAGPELSSAMPLAERATDRQTRSANVLVPAM
jgi:hypothetical protein